jgi:hypothetical protein
MIDASLAALAKHPWQSTLSAVILAGLALLLSRNSARVRHYKVRWVQSSPSGSVDPAVPARSLEEQIGLHLEARPVTVQMINIVSVKLP